MTIQLHPFTTTVDGSEVPNNHLECKKCCKYWDKTTNLLVQGVFHQQYQNNLQRGHPGNQASFGYFWIQSFRTKVELFFWKPCEAYLVRWFVTKRADFTPVPSSNILSYIKQWKLIGMFFLEERKAKLVPELRHIRRFHKVHISRICLDKFIPPPPRELAYSYSRYVEWFSFSRGVIC